MDWSQALSGDTVTGTESEKLMHPRVIKTNLDKLSLKKTSQYPYKPLRLEMLS